MAERLVGCKELEKEQAVKAVRKTRKNHLAKHFEKHCSSSVAEMGEQQNVFHIEKESPHEYAALIDLDSCALDFFGVFLPIMEKETGITKTVKDFTTFNIDEVYEISKEEVLRILTESDYMRTMRPFEFLNQFIAWLRSFDLRIVFSTSRTFAPHCFEDTLNNLREHEVDFDELHLVSGVKWRHKPNGIVGYEVYVDDAPYHLENFFAGKRACDPDVPTQMLAPVIPYNAAWHLQYEERLGRIDLTRGHIPYRADGSVFKLLSEKVNENE